ncbi:MAG: hypothetical protein ACXVRW_05640 [Solirubrobacteraceae bacterium]
MRTALALGPHLFSPALSAADTAALLARWRPAEVVALLSAA